ncbi:receptor activity-modifying protein 1-like isoform X2 [Astyanax mexicanus]|uniref:receptor activity-modifying protein 1-like isoform X2 n=1 Tax=Astyanax mexicanus TaxID=7994 RepID=UPI0020CB44F2|nr:receptor activity-modifying protein 1-like isoform X2 [Astyanax mexicanus]
MLSGLLLLLLPLISGQTVGGKLMASDEVIHMQNASVTSGVNNTTHGNDTYNRTSQLHKDVHLAENGTFKIDADHNVTYEDQESFQDQEKFHFHWKCNEDLLMLYGEYCLNITFHTGMMELGESNWCDWDMVIKHYNFLTYCLEIYAGEARCFYPSPVIHKLFLDVHQQYFSSCSSSEEEEAPESVVIILTLLPVCIIPIAVYMVIKRSNVK